MYLNYRIDAVIPELNLAIEFDENDHRGYDIEKEKERESLIKKKYNLIRLSSNKKANDNLAILLNEIN